MFYFCVCCLCHNEEGCWINQSCGLAELWKKWNKRIWLKTDGRATAAGTVPLRWQPPPLILCFRKLLTIQTLNCSMPWILFNYSRSYFFVMIFKILWLIHRTIQVYGCSNNLRQYGSQGSDEESLLWPQLQTPVFVWGHSKSSLGFMTRVSLWCCKTQDVSAVHRPFPVFAQPAFQCPASHPFPGSDNILVCLRSTLIFYKWTRLCDICVSGPDLFLWVSSSSICTAATGRTPSLSGAK